MKRTSMFLALMGLLLAGGAFAADNVTADDLTADQIIEQFIEARGGRDAWKKVDTATMQGVMSMPSQGVEMPISMEFKRPNMLRMELNFQGMTMVQAYDGEKGWAIMPMMGKPDPEEMADDQVKQILDMTDFDGPLVDYADKGHAVELLGKEEVEGTEAYKLKVTKKNGDVVTTFIESENFIEIRQQSKQDMQGVEVDATTDYGDYKEVDGLMMPHSIAVSMGGPALQTITINSIDLNPEIDAERFAMPEKPEMEKAPSDAG